MPPHLLRRAALATVVLRLGTASDDLEIHLEEVWVLVHLRAHSLDVVVQHPLLGMLAEREARQVAFLALEPRWAPL